MWSSGDGICIDGPSGYGTDALEFCRERETGELGGVMSVMRSDEVARKEVGLERLSVSPCWGLVVAL